MAKKQSYYVTIKGRKYDRSLIQIADSAVSGKKDGRISVADAKKLLAAAKDKGLYTEIEKQTIEYIQKNYQFTKKSDEWLREELSKIEPEESQEVVPSTTEPPESGKNQESTSYYRNYIPTPSAGKIEKKNGLPILILSFSILLIIGLGVYFSFKSSGTNSSKKRIAENRTEESEKKLNSSEKLGQSKGSENRSAKELDDQSRPSSEKGFLGFFSGKSEPANLTGADEELRKDIEGSIVKFEKNSIQMHSESRKVLNQLTRLLKRHPNLKAILVGHASDEGKEEANFRISQLRAEMVRDYLVGNGLSSDRFILEAKGNREPKSARLPNTQNREMNRRVEITVVQ
ncbi:hypothetical protein CH373_07630 [Leptospira perolatii]|uniref:OmpA-like domain-containing protein n=1 Tax=Leptospira perolatii TaxID=2023191 RepID=A0A2M9ZPN1_9LEPT|nr:OmpA family protein [Leptospira perolatii]PJZ70776.1 hypothetical protein CH360_04490 [Leptospira perolatii]PJZ73984.1 hypothetical protein CH373_07630 [Leptospira perolatii]